MTTTETYTRDEQDRAIDWAFQMGFGNALAQLTAICSRPVTDAGGDAVRRAASWTPQPPSSGTGRYPFSGPPTWKTLQTVEEHVGYEVTRQGHATCGIPRHEAQDAPRAPLRPLARPGQDKCPAKWPA